MKQDGPEISGDAWKLKGYGFLLKLLSSGIFFGTCTISRVFWHHFFSNKKAPKLIAIIHRFTKFPGGSEPKIPT